MTTKLNNLLFQYCQKIVLFDKDLSKVFLAKRRNEKDFDGVFSFIGGKMETTDSDFLTGLRREKNEEIGSTAKIRIYPLASYNAIYTKRDGSRMILPHYIALFDSGKIQLNEEYSESKWIRLEDLDSFEPKIETIEEATLWAKDFYKKIDNKNFEII